MSRILLGLNSQIRADHKRIRHRICTLLDRRVIAPESLKTLLVEIGAHHLAEEETLYEFLMRTDAVAVTQSHVHHSVLDDLIFSICQNSPIAGTVHSQLRVLLRLLDDHFVFEEERMLTVKRVELSMDLQKYLGQKYRATYLNNLCELRETSVPQYWPDR